MNDEFENFARGVASCTDTEFIVVFNAEMNRLGYICNRVLGGGDGCDQKMFAFTKAGVKSQKVYARVYLWGNEWILRLYFSQVDKHTEFIEQAPDFIQQAFTGDYGTCGHCNNRKEDGSCNHRKSYTIHGRPYELCDGYAFGFTSPSKERIPDYIKLFLTFYPERKRKA